MLVKNVSEKWQIWVDYIDLNKVFPKDAYTTTQYRPTFAWSSQP